MVKVVLATAAAVGSPTRGWGWMRLEASTPFLSDHYMAAEAEQIDSVCCR